MQILETRPFEEIRRWMYRNARPLELARWQFHFENGSAENVLRVLSSYQNDDGGFGHALDSDNWNPNSTPYNAGLAIGIFRELGIYNPNHSVVKRTFEFLNGFPYSGDYGWPFSIPSNNDYPHAPWWTYSEENNSRNGYHAAGGIAGYILRCGGKGSGIYEKALDVADGMMVKLHRSDMLEQHEIGAYCTLLRDIQSAMLTERFDTEYLFGKLRVMVNEAIERDPAKWPFYSMRPSQYVDSAESMFYPGNEEIVNKEMDYILSTRHNGGVWDISWKWDDYPGEFAISERWWQGYWAIYNLLIIKNYGRLNLLN